MNLTLFAHAFFKSLLANGQHQTDRELLEMELLLPSNRRRHGRRELTATIKVIGAQRPLKVASLHMLRQLYDGSAKLPVRCGQTL